MAQAVLTASSGCSNEPADIQPKWVSPSDSALIVHNSAHEEGKSLRHGTSTLSTSAGSTSSSDDERLSISVSGDSEDEAEQLEPAADLLVDVERHLENMNMASEAVNDAQQALKEVAQRRQALEQAWADGSVRLAKAVGMDKLAKATPYHQQWRRCKVSHQAVEQASIQYQTALSAESSVQRDDIIQLQAKHAAYLAEYHAAQQVLKKLKAQAGLSRRDLDAALPYFDAQDEHNAQLAGTASAMRKLEQQLDSAKARYRGALRSLEALSEQEHRQRAAGGCSNSGSDVVEG